MTDTNQKLREAFSRIRARLMLDVIDSHTISLVIADCDQALALPTADHIPDAGEMVVDHFPDATKMIETAAPVGDLPELPLPTSIPGFYDIEARKRCVYTADQMRAYALSARAALRAGDAVDAQRYRWLREQHWSNSDICCVDKPKQNVRLGGTCPSGDLLDSAIDAAMRKGQL